MGLKVVAPGVLSLVQDLGRMGVARQGLSVGGPVDMHAFCWANYLLDNSANTPALEITMGGAAFSALSDVMLSICGADLCANVDGKPIGNWRSFTLRKGQTLKLGYAKTGMRAYLAVRGGYDVPMVFDSASTVVRNGIGGLAERAGKALAVNDILPVKANEQAIRDDIDNWVPRRFIPKYSDCLSIGVIESYQADKFSVEARYAFYEKPYVVTDKMDRMGMRLEGNVVQCDVSGIISEGIALGAIQFPANGQPIILLNDRQTLGGYPKLGCVSKMSLMKLAQAKPGTRLNFFRAEIENESDAYRQFMTFFDL
ncbi:5-oxoprolinase subunit C family protein [Vibrio sp. RC27]